MCLSWWCCDDRKNCFTIIIFSPFLSLKHHTHNWWNPWPNICIISFVRFIFVLRFLSLLISSSFYTSPWHCITFKIHGTKAFFSISWMIHKFSHEISNFSSLFQFFLLCFVATLCFLLLRIFGIINFVSALFSFNFMCHSERNGDKSLLQ